MLLCCFNTFIAPVVADADYVSILHWWKCAITCVPAGAAVSHPMAFDFTVVAADPAEQQVLQRWLGGASLSYVYFKCLV